MSYKPDLSDLQTGARLAHRAAGGAHRRRHRERRPGPRREAADDPRARRRGVDQPPDRRARLPAAGRAGLRRRPGRPRDVRARRTRPCPATPRTRTGSSPRCAPARAATPSRCSPSRSAPGATRSRWPPASRPHELLPTAEMAAAGGVDPRRRRGGAGVPAGRGAAGAARAARRARRPRRLGAGRRRDRRHDRRPPGHRPRRAHRAGPGRRGRDRVADLHRLAHVALRRRRAGARRCRWTRTASTSRRSSGC